LKISKKMKMGLLIFLLYGNPLFIVMITPLAPALPPLGAGALCDASVLPVQEISPRLCTGKMALSQPGMP
jgi:hypothetical protein